MNSTKTTVLSLMLLVSAQAFGSISDVASSVVNLPVRALKSTVSLTQEVVNAVADVERSVFHMAVDMPMAGVKHMANFVAQHEASLWRMASVASLAAAVYKLNEAYKKNCPMASCGKR